MGKLIAPHLVGGAGLLLFFLFRFAFFFTFFPAAAYPLVWHFSADCCERVCFADSFSGVVERPALGDQLTVFVAVFCC